MDDQANRALEDYRSATAAYDPRPDLTAMLKERSQ
jgi:hypothetical protein